MGEVVELVDAPVVAGAVVLDVEDAVERGVAHVDVRVRHVDFGAQDVGAVGEFSGLHAGEQVEVFRARVVAVRAVGASPEWQERHP